MKRLIAILLIMVIAFGCVACGSVPSKTSKKRFIKIDEYMSTNGYVIQLVYDPETKVEYFLRGDLMCPRYDENGDVTFYGGN